MSKQIDNETEGGRILAKIIGRAALNDEFLEKLKQDPKNAVEDMNIDLPENLIVTLRSIDWSILERFNNHLDSTRGDQNNKII